MNFRGGRQNPIPFENGGMPMKFQIWKQKTKKKETRPLPMEAGQKKMFVMYVVLVLGLCLGAVSAYAANDPLKVVR